MQPHSPDAQALTDESGVRPTEFSVAGNTMWITRDNVRDAAAGEWEFDGFLVVSRSRWLKERDQNTHIDALFDAYGY